VVRERKELQALLESTEGEARAELEREIARDPLAFEPEAGFGKARLAFGPFLALATIEYMLFGDIIVQLVFP
jgi:leader peptidase (prepilin peptidase)/N-methyltransferase